MGAVIGFGFDLMLQTPFGLSALVYGLAGYAVGTAVDGHDRVHPVDPGRRRRSAASAAAVACTPPLAACSA